MPVPRRTSKSVAVPARCCSSRCSPGPIARARRPGSRSALAARQSEAGVVGYRGDAARTGNQPGPGRPPRRRSGGVSLCRLTRTTPTRLSSPSSSCSRGRWSPMGSSTPKGWTAPSTRSRPAPSCSAGRDRGDWLGGRPGHCGRGRLRGCPRWTPCSPWTRRAGGALAGRARSWLRRQPALAGGRRWRGLRRRRGGHPARSRRGERAGALAARRGR